MARESYDQIAREELRRLGVEVVGEEMASGSRLWLICRYAGKSFRVLSAISRGGGRGPANMRSQIRRQVRQLTARS